MNTRWLSRSSRAALLRRVPALDKYRWTWILLVLSAGFIAIDPNARAEDPSVARMVFLEAKPGTKARLEKAIKKQMDWRRSQKDDWQWLTWEYVSGESGRYGVATFGHAWEDYDREKVAPWVEELNGAALTASSATAPLVQYFDHVDEVSAFGSGTNAPTMAEIAIFQLQFGKTSQFYEAVRQFHEALQQAGSGERYEWFELLSGGELPQFMLFLPRPNWAGFDTRSELLMDALEKSAGSEKAKTLIAQFNASVKTYQRYAVRLRPDLSKLSRPAPTSDR